MTALFSFWQHRSQRQHREQAEDALKHLHAREWHGRIASRDSLAGALRLSPSAVIKLIERMEAQGWIRSTADSVRLTSEGEQQAVAVIRAHRLWERYLADEARMPLAQIHAEAERREHDYSPETLAKLEADLGHPTTDPHGDPIPNAAGEMARANEHSLTDWKAQTPAKITHIEDEPSAIFAQIAAAGLRPGDTIRVLEADATRLVISDGDKTCVLAPIIAANIFVAPALVENPETHPRLTALKNGQRATIKALAESLQGFTRRRLLDLGLTPGASISVELPSMFNDPVAYRVRGALIALRREQAEQVLIDVQ
jgi:DtxR family Mn-dependent transcriptional regulator